MQNNIVNFALSNSSFDICTDTLLPKKVPLPFFDTTAAKKHLLFNQKDLERIGQSEVQRVV